MDYIIVVPTHRRVATFRTKTYAFLQRTNAKPPVLWVNDFKDYTEYSEAFPELEIKVGGENIGEKRNHIQYYYPENTKIVMIDDDIKNVVVYDPDEIKKKRDLENFDALIQLGFNYCTKYNVSMFGVYPVDNALFMKDNIRTTPCYIIAALFGIINKRISVKTNYAEDFERSILHYINEKRLLRLDFIGLTTKYYKEKGGLQTSRTEEKNYNDKKYLADTYPHIVKMITKRNSAELSFLNARGGTIKVEVPLDL